MNSHILNHWINYKANFPFPPHDYLSNLQYFLADFYEHLKLS